MKKYIVLLLAIAMPLISSSWNAQYHYVALEQFRFAQVELPKIKLSGNERMLDIGCGTGRASYLYAQHVPQGFVLGIDSSEDLIKFAQKEYANVKNLSFEIADVSQINFNEEFDIISSFFCLHWVQDTQKEAIRNIARALKPGGKAYLYINVIEDKKTVAIMHSNIEEILATHPTWRSYISLANFQPAQVWLSYAQEAGFIIDNWYVTSLEHLFDTKLQCQEYNYTLGTTRLPDEEHRKFIDLIIDKLYSDCNLKDDELFIQRAQIVALELTKRQEDFL